MQQKDVPFCRTGFQINLFLLLDAYCCTLWEFFVLSTLEKNHQMLRSGPWSLTYDLGWIKNKKSSPCFRKMFWKSSLYMSTSSLFFLIPRIHVHTEFEVIIFDCAENHLCGRLKGDCCLKSLKEKQIILYSQHLPKSYSFNAPRMEKIHEMLWKSHFHVETITFLCFFLCCLPWSWTKDSICGLSFGSSQ